MATPITTSCSHCGAVFKLKDDSSVGKRVKCAKCGEAFVVKLAGTGKSKAQVDDDYDWEEADDDDVADDFDDDVQDVPRKTSGVKKKASAQKGKKGKKGKKGERSSNLLLLVGGGLGALAVVALLGVGIYFAAMSLKPVPLTRFSFVTDDMVGFVELAPRKVVTFPFVHEIRQAAIAEGTQAADLDMLFDGHVDRVVFAFGAGGEKDLLAIAYLDRPTRFDPSLAGGRATKMSHHGQSYYLVGAEAVWMFSPFVQISGAHARVKQAIETRRNPPATTKFASLPDKQDFLFYNSKVEFPPMGEIPPVVPGLVPTIQSLQKMRTIQVTMNAVNGLQININCGFGSGEEVNSVKTGLENLRNYGKGVLQSLAANPEFGADVTEGIKFLDAIAMTVQDNSLVFPIQLDPATIQKLQTNVNKVQQQFQMTPPLPGRRPEGQMRPLGPGASPGIPK